MMIQAECCSGDQLDKAVAEQLTNMAEQILDELVAVIGSATDDDDDNDDDDECAAAADDDDDNCDGDDDGDDDDAARRRRPRNRAIIRRNADCDDDLRGSWDDSAAHMMPSSTGRTEPVARDKAAQAGDGAGRLARVSDATAVVPRVAHSAGGNARLRAAGTPVAGDRAEQ